MYMYIYNIYIYIYIYICMYRTIEISLVESNNKTNLIAP